MNTNQVKPVDKAFFNLPTLSLAKKLLGCLLVHESIEGITAGFIVETEAYLGKDDRAAHSFNNRRTKRTEIMFGEAGLTYMYTMHTHHLINVVAEEVNTPRAVLIRAIEPTIGEHLMLQRRPVPNRFNLTSGPGKLTKAMGIDQIFYGHPLWEKPLYIAEGIRIHEKEIKTGPRIGIPNTGEAKDYPYRFWIENNPFVSR